MPAIWGAGQWPCRCWIDDPTRIAPCGVPIIEILDKVQETSTGRLDCCLSGEHFRGDQPYYPRQFRRHHTYFSTVLRVRSGPAIADIQTPGTIADEPARKPSRNWRPAVLH